MISLMRFLAVHLLILLTYRISLLNYNGWLQKMVIKNGEIIRKDWERWDGEYWSGFWWAVTPDVSDSVFEYEIKHHIFHHCNVVASAKDTIRSWEVKGILKVMDPRVIEALEWKLSFDSP